MHNSCSISLYPYTNSEENSKFSWIRCFEVGLLVKSVVEHVRKGSLNKVKKNKFACFTSLQTKIPAYTVMYEGPSTSRRPHIPPNDQRIFDQQVPLTRTRRKAPWYAELSHTQKITDRKPFSILYRRVPMFDQALCLLI